VRIDKWDCITLKNCTSKKTITKMKIQPLECKKIFAITDKGLISRLYKEFKKLNTKRINNPFNKCANELNSFQKTKCK
jgi:hypothetical protein